MLERGMPEMRGSGSGRCSKEGVRGFTLAETVLTVSIFVVIGAGLTSVFTMSISAWKEGSTELSLQSSGRLIMEKIVRGPGGLFGLQEATEKSVRVENNGRGIAFLVDKNSPPTYSNLDDSEVRIYLENSMIMYDGSTGTVGDEVPIVSFGRVEDVRFEVNENTVTIQLWMSEACGTNDTSHVKFQTKVFLRKSQDQDEQT